jgi:hypothetical protein
MIQNHGSGEIRGWFDKLTTDLALLIRAFLPTRSSEMPAHPLVGDATPEGDQRKK